MKIYQVSGSRQIIVLDKTKHSCKMHLTIQLEVIILKILYS